MFGFLKAQPPRKTEGRSITVNGRSLPLTVRENARATRMTLRIEPGGRALKLTVPRGLSRRAVDEFLERHHGWLMTRLSRFPDSVEHGEGSRVTIRGVDHRIVLTGKLRGLAEEAMENGEAILRVSGLPEHTGRRIADHLKRVAKAELEPRVHHHAAACGGTVRSISWKDTKSRWGSCTHDGNLSFSWRIAMAPPFVIDYLAAHEVAHLIEMNHGPHFWALCRRLCPRTDEAKTWLKKNGSQLHALRF